MSPSWIILHNDYELSTGVTAGPAERRLGLWINGAGHYHTRRHSVSERVREDWLVMHVVAGRGMIRNGPHSLAVPTGAAVVCFPHLAHEYRSDPHEGWEIWWAHFDGPTAPRLVELCGLHPERAMILPGVEAGLVAAWSRLMEILGQREPHAGPRASAQLYRILVDLACSNQLSGHDQHRLLDAAEGAPDDLDAMAASAGMSRFRFARAFKRGMGITPWRYVLLRRIAQAKQLLAGSDLSVKEIASTCGFSDPDYFSRAFRREAGLTPGSYRRQRT